MDILVEKVKKNASKNPQKAAVCVRGESITYKELYENGLKAAFLLHKKGIRKGDRVLIEAVAKVEFVITFLGVQAAGGVTVPVMRACKEDILEYIYKQTKAKYYVHAGKLKNEKIEGEMYQEFLSESKEQKMFDYVQPDEDDLLELIYTTGTTGKPKGTMHTARAISCNINNTKNGIGMLQNDVILIPLPLNHSFALRVFRSALHNNETVVLQNSAISYIETSKNIDNFNCNAVICVNTAMEMMMSKAGERKVADIFGKLRYIEFSAGPLSMKLRQRLPEILPDVQIHNTWGSSETGGCLFLNITDNPEKIASMGKPIETVETAICLDNGDIVKQSGKEVVGRLAMKGNMRTKGYYGRDDKSKEVIKDGWLIMSDLVWQDDDGYLYMRGRADDIMNIGGEKVAPAEIEETALKYEGIKESVVIGVRDEKGSMGEVPVLFYVKESETSIDPDKFRSFLSESLAHYKVPVEIIKKAVIPKNSIGKVDRKAIKSDWNSRKINQNDVIQNILSRRSIRVFQDRPVSDHDISLLLQCGKCAPSGKNLKTRRFTVINDKNEIARFKNILKEVTEDKKIPLNGFHNPSLLIIVSNDRRNQDGIQDAACSVENMMLAAHSIGLGSVWLNALMNICDEVQIREILYKYRIPQNHIVWAVMAVGYPAEDGRVPEERGNEVQYIG